jgi:hypothetical protein
VRRRVEIRLADLQMDDVAALGLELSRARQHFEGALYADAAHPLGELHVSCPLADARDYNPSPRQPRA